MMDAIPGSTEYRRMMAVRFNPPPKVWRENGLWFCQHVDEKRQAIDFAASVGVGNTPEEAYVDYVEEVELLGATMGAAALYTPIE